MDSLFFGIMIAKINRVSKLFNNRFPIVQALDQKQILSAGF